MTDKETIKKQILSCNNSSTLEEFDFSLFGDEDVDVFERLVVFDNHYNNYYATLSDKLKNERSIVVQAAKCFHNLPLIPKKFFEDKDVVKSILYARNEKKIPAEYFTEDMINYMFRTCCRCSLEEVIQPFIDKHLKKETVIEVLEHYNSFVSNSLKTGAHPCVDNIYLPRHMLNDKDIVKLLFVSHFDLVEDNLLVDKNLILDVINSDCVIEHLPESFYNDIELIKKVLEKEHNYRIFNNYQLNKKVKYNDQLIKEIIDINPKVLSNHRFEISYDIFKQLIEKDINNLFYSSLVYEKDEKKLYDLLTSEDMLPLFKNKNGYDFSILYSRHHYYKNPIVENKFIIEQMARQDHLIFTNISENLVDDNEFMAKIFFECGAEYDHKKEQIDAFLDKVEHFGSFDKYLKNLLLEYSLNNSLSQKENVKRKKI